MFDIYDRPTHVEAYGALAGETLKIFQFFCLIRSACIQPYLENFFFQCLGSYDVKKKICSGAQSLFGYQRK